MTVRVIESLVQGKRSDPDLCEDVLVTTDHFVAVIDGATDVTGAVIHGMSGGRFAATTIADAIITLAPDVTAAEAIATLSGALARALDGVALPPAARPPAAALVLYSAARREVWRVGDGIFAIDAVTWRSPKAIDEVTAAWRRAWTHALLLGGARECDILRDDPGFTAAWPLIQLQDRFVNTVGTPYSYGALTGTPVPDEHLEVYPLGAGARTLTMASDGYLTLLGDLAATEAHRAAAVAADPMSLGGVTANRATRPGWDSFDDRTYVRVDVTNEVRAPGGPRL